MAKARRSIRGFRPRLVAINGADDTFCGLADSLERRSQHFRGDVIAGEIEAALGPDAVMCKDGIADGLGLQLTLLKSRLLAVLFMLQFMGQLMDDDSAACSRGKRLLD